MNGKCRIPDDNNFNSKYTDNEKKKWIPDREIGRRGQQKRNKVMHALVKALI